MFTTPFYAGFGCSAGAALAKYDVFRKIFTFDKPAAEEANNLIPEAGAVPQDDQRSN